LPSSLVRYQKEEVKTLRRQDAKISSGSNNTQA
jgi:hypothetical protein